MSALKRTILPCPCRSRRCRILYAARILAIVASNGAQFVILHHLGAF